MQFVFQTRDFGKMLLSVSQSTTQNLDSLAVAVREISSHQLRSNSDFFLTLSIFTPFVVQIPGYGKMLLNVSQNTTQNLDALALVICEISTQELRSNLDFFQTLSISTPFLFQILISDTRLWENVAKCKSKYHTKCGYPSCYNL